MPESFNVSLVLHHLESLNPNASGLQLHGANLNISKFIAQLLQSKQVDRLEIFLSGSDYGRSSVMGSVAERILPSWRVGEGSLRFFPHHALPDVWKDGVERVLLCLDPEMLARDRYLRDKFAVGPTVISCQTHGMGNIAMYRQIAPILNGPPVDFDCLVCLSNACKATFIETFKCYLRTPDGRPPLRLEVVPNGTDCSRIQPFDSERKRHTRRLFGLSEEGVLVLYLARLTPNSKADLLPLLDAFAEVSGPRDLLLCVGPENVPGYIQQLVKRAQDLGLGRRFAVRERVDHELVPLMYGMADLYVLPTDNVQEAFVTSALEAMAAGLPVLASDWDGIKDSVLDGETGYRVPTYLLPGLENVEDISPVATFMNTLLLVGQNTWIDPNVFRERLKTLLSSADIRAKLGAAGRLRAETFTWAAVAEAHFRIWAGLLKSARQETDSDKRGRRNSADLIGQPVPYRQLFSCYGTGPMTATTARIKLSKKGLDILRSGERLTFYDEAMSLLRPEMIDHLLKVLGERHEHWTTMAEIGALAADRTGLTLDQALFHLGLFAKHEVVDLSIEP
jgi:glycosyltransferase involved in cell wall biosynthesis